MGRRLLHGLPLLGALVALAATPALAGSGGYSKTGEVDLTGNPLKKFDISWFDPSSGKYLLADRSNARIDVVQAATNTLLAPIGVGHFAGASPQGNDHSGPNGVLVDDQGHVWAGDGNSTVKVFNLATGTLLATISTGGRLRADEMAVDNRDHELVVANDADAVPFVTLISTDTMQVIAKIAIPHATNGLEQSVWDPVTGRFYLSIPQLGPNAADGAIAVINPLGRVIEGFHHVSECEPAGLAIDVQLQHLVVGCSGDAIAAGFAAKTLVMQAGTAHVLATITQVGGSDEVWFNPHDNHYYVAASSNPAALGGPSLGVIDAATNTFIGSVKTFAGAHSVAASSLNNEIFVPLPAGAPQCAVVTMGCIGIYSK